MDKEGLADSFYLTDIDECATTNDACGANGTCVDVVNGYTCVCDAGYHGDNCSYLFMPCEWTPAICQNGGTCNECPTVCDNGLNYECSCPSGYNGTNCEDVFSIGQYKYLCM